MMNIKVAAAVIVALASAGVLAQPSHHRALRFGDEVVTLKFSNVPSYGELERLWDATNEATDPVEQERLWRIRWEDFGETIALQALANFHLDRGDLVQAYAHLFAVNKIAKWYETVAAKKPGRIIIEIHLNIETNVEVVGNKLTARERKAGVSLAATLIRNNPNCCTAI